jgi:hypothetical protein
MATVYVNGEQIGQSTVDQWDETERFAFQAPCDSPTLYAFEVCAGLGRVVALPHRSSTAPQIRGETRRRSP